MTSTNAKVLEVVRDFVAGHPGGWGHEEWLHLLSELAGAGLDTAGPEEIGVLLERERLRSFLSGVGVKGLGPKRTEAVVSRFGRLWDLQHATVDDVASVTGIPRSLAESLVHAVG